MTKSRWICRAGPRVLSVLVAANLLCAVPAAAQTGTVSGVVADSASRAPLGNAEVRLVAPSGTVAASALTTRDGTFVLPAGVGAYTLVVTRVGYLEQRISVRSGPASIRVEVSMAPAALSIDPVTVTVGRVAQTAMDAPTAVSVVGRERIRQQVAISAADVVPHMPGVNTVTMGLGHYSYSARGAASTGFGGGRTLVDFRFGTMPSVSATIPMLEATSALDIERIELIRGPATALYGAGAAQGILHIITRSPFDSEGTTVSVTGGTRSLLQTAFRHARRFNDQLAWKVTGEYFRGDDWEYVDPVEAANREDAIDAGADPDTLLIGARDPGTESYRVATTLEWRPDEQTSVVASAGRSELVNMITTPEGTGGLQGRNLSVSYVQTRVTRGSLFANVFFGLNDFGESYTLRTGLPSVDNSWNGVAQVQHGVSLGERTRIRYGGDIQRTVPKTGGLYHGRYEDDDLIVQGGVFLNATHALTPVLDVVAAVRLDEHNRVDETAFSPMAGLVYRPAPAHAFRATYNRAFAPPLNVLLFPDIVVQTAGPYSVRFTAIPQNGFQFRRDCGGLCMRSPFNAGGPEQFLPTDATAVWGGLVQAMLAFGVDLSAIPTPTATDISSVLSAPASTVADIQPLNNTYLNTFEVGYKGLLADRLYVTADVIRTQSTNFRGNLRVITPTVTLEETSLAAYLGRFMPQGQADAVAAGMSTIPGGVVTPENALDPYDLIVSSGSVGASLVRWRAEFSADLQLDENWTVGGSYSWVDNDSIPDFGGVVDVFLNQSKSLGTLRVGYMGSEVSGQVQGRAVKSFPFSSGVFAGPVPGYAVLDASIEWRLPWTEGLSFSVSGTNLLGNEHIELIGMPQIGRLIMTRVRVDL